MAAGLLVVGEATCALNPVYAQGMSVAAMSAHRLRDLLHEGVDDCATLQKEMAAGNDRARTRTDGATRPGPGSSTGRPAVTMRARAHRAGPAALGEASLDGVPRYVRDLDLAVLKGIAAFLGTALPPDAPRTAGQVADVLQTASRHRWIQGHWPAALTGESLVKREPGARYLGPRRFRRSELAEARETLDRARTRRASGSPDTPSRVPASWLRPGPRRAVRTGPVRSGGRRERGAQRLAYRDAVGRVRESLAPGGALLLVETCHEHHQSLASMPFLLSARPGGSRPERRDGRAGTGRTYLTRRESLAAVRTAGLAPLLDLPRPDHPPAAFSQRLFVAAREP
ncbi:hypothetical protein [Actinomadura welshii]|uniref:hypothetical protein n=1 Tax=Actinomadura welshii TaxID=3103817 RepID=UPI0003AD0FF8|nr:hypothetical protein [Actinomadura madurae]